MNTPLKLSEVAGAVALFAALAAGVTVAFTALLCRETLVGKKGGGK